MQTLRQLYPLWQRLPGTCQVCARWPAQTVCAACESRFGAPRCRCTTCARPVSGERAQCGACLTERLAQPLSLCLAAVDYAYPWDTLIARFKFRGEPALAHALAALMWQRPEVQALLISCDAVVPIPVTSARLAERGYNQAWELAKVLLRLAGSGPVAAKGLPMALVRTGHAPDQHNLPAERRINNLKGAFVTDPEHCARWQGAHVVLVDDVSTTGATLRAAASALKQAGASQVSAVVLARTEAD